MSKTLFVEYESDGFWAYDVAVGILLKHLIDRARQQEERAPTGWLSSCIQHWCINAVLSDYGLHLDPNWSVDQRRLVCAMIDDACAILQKRSQIPDDEAASWDLLDGKGVFARGAKQIPTAPSVELGRAIVLLLEGQLPRSPVGARWLYGVEGGVSTIEEGAERGGRPNAAELPRESGRQ